MTERKSQVECPRCRSTFCSMSAVTTAGVTTLKFECGCGERLFLKPGETLAHAFNKRKATP